MGGSQRRRIWLCADDFGISPAVNTAIRDLVVRRRLNATSAMVVAPSFHRTEASALDALNAAAPRVAIGLHVTLTAPFRPLSKSFMPLREGAFPPLAQRFADRKGLVLDILSYRFRSRAAALGLHTNPAFAGTYEFDDAADFAALFPRFLDRLPDGSVVMCHPGFVDAELQRLDPLTTLREKEYAFFAGDAFPAMLATHGVALA